MIPGRSLSPSFLDVRFTRKSKSLAGKNIEDFSWTSTLEVRDIDGKLESQF